MSNSLLDQASKGAARAKRFAIHIPIHYRKPQTSRWFEGRTENISYSGVLFRAEFPLQPKTTVELRFELPAAILGEAPGEVVCKGAVVRIEESPIAGIPLALAVAIDGYRMARG
ncbi:MAG: PilZ domain-containing protein [Terriglobia bacterium]